MKYIKVVLAALLMCSSAYAQDDLLKEIDTTWATSSTGNAFKGLQICSMQSTKTAAKKEFYAVVSHRFGDLQHGLDNFFGLDNALTKIGVIYGLTDWLSVAGSRHTYNKTYELAAKYRLALQKEGGSPVTIVGYNTWDINSELEKELYPNLKAADRFAFSTQLLISRKFSEAISAEIAPVYVHKNLYEPLYEEKDQFLVAAGGRCKITKRMSINLEYAARVNTPESTTLYKNPLTVGLDIETGGHVFQLVFSNSQPMNDVSYYTNAAGNWGKGSAYFGFNMYRVF
jgi:hypothetical protein